MRLLLSADHNRVTARVTVPELLALQAQIAHLLSAKLVSNHPEPGQQVGIIVDRDGIRQPGTLNIILCDQDKV